MTRTRTQMNTFDIEKKAFFVVCGLLLAITLLYTYFVTASIAHVVMREEFIQNTNMIAEEVAGLERNYLARAGAMSEESALAFGLVPATERVFVERRTLTFRSAE